MFTNHKEEKMLKYFHVNNCQIVEVKFSFVNHKFLNRNDVFIKILYDIEKLSLKKKAFHKSSFLKAPVKNVKLLLSFPAVFREQTLKVFIQKVKKIFV